MILGIIISSIALAYIFGNGRGILGSGPGGAHGLYISKWLNSFIGVLGTGILLSVLMVSYLMLAFKINPSSIIAFIGLKPAGKDIGSETDSDITQESNEAHTSDSQEIETNTDKKDLDFSIINTIKNNTENEEDLSSEKGSIVKDLEADEDEKKNGVSISITKAEGGEELSEKEMERLQEDYDPKLDLSGFQMPPISLLEDYRSDGKFDDSEILEKKKPL